MPLGPDTCCNVNYDPLASIKRLLSVPRCCVLPEDMVSGLAMHGKPVALSRGATMLGIRGALTVELVMMFPVMYVSMYNYVGTFFIRPGFPSFFFGFVIRFFPLLDAAHLGCFALGK